MFMDWVPPQSARQRFKFSAQFSLKIGLHNFLNGFSSQTNRIRCSYDRKQPHTYIGRGHLKSQRAFCFLTCSLGNKFILMWKEEGLIFNFILAIPPHLQYFSVEQNICSRQIHSQRMVYTYSWMYISIAVRYRNRWKQFVDAFCVHPQRGQNGAMNTGDRVEDAWGHGVFPYLSISFLHASKNSYRLGISAKGYTSISCFKVILQNGKVFNKSFLPICNQSRPLSLSIPVVC